MGWRGQWVLAWSVSLLLAATAVSAQDTPVLRGAGGAAGIGQYKGEKWGLVATTVANPTEKDVELLVTLSFDKSPRVQFAAPVWLPPNSSRRVWFPVRPPAFPEGERALDTEGLLLDTTRSPEAQVSRQQGLLVASRDEWLGGILADVEDDLAIQTMVAMRESVALSRRLSYLTSDAAPPIATGWEALNTFTVCANEPKLDAAQISALRQWVIAGGRLWIMLDQVDPSFGQRLLLDDWSIQVVDRVELPTFQIDRDDSSRKPIEMSFEVPVDHVRVLAPGFETIHSVNGWPASMRRQIGAGWVLVTTLDPRGWRSAEGALDANDALTELGDWFNHAPQPVDPQPPLTTHTIAQIGYGIADRATIAPVMIGFCALLLVAGVLLIRKGRLELLPIYGGGLAVVTAVVLLGIGASSREDVPATVAQTQLVRIAPQQGQAVITAAVGVYTPDEQQIRLAADGGGVAWPQQARRSGGTLRMIWPDFDRWQWQRLASPAGSVEAVEFSRVKQLDRAMNATAHFGPDGLAGNVDTGPVKPLEDMLIVTPEGLLATRGGDKGGFVAASTDRLGEGQFIASNVLNEEQLHRQDVYRALLANRDTITGPMLFGWTSAFDTGLSALDGAQERGSSLVSIPLDIAQAKGGDRVSIPSPMIRLSPIRPAGRRATLNIYNPARREWMALSNGGTAYMRFDVPTEVLPLKVGAGTLTMRISAPGRTVDVFQLDGDTERPIANRRNPIGMIDMPLPADAIRIERDGGLVIGLRVSNLDDPTSLQTWTVERMDLTVSGEVGP